MERALLALSAYHYLMPRQFTRLPGFPNRVDAVHKLLRRFPAEKAEVACVRSGVERGRGMIPRLYYLTRQGAETVAELLQAEPESVFYPKGDKLPISDVPHRAMTVDFWIELNRYAETTGGAVEFFHPYFRTTGANRNPDSGTRLKKLTRLDFPPELARKHKKPFFWPDGVFILRTALRSPGDPSGSPDGALAKSGGPHSQKRLLCLLECYRGIDTGRVIRQLEWHLLALEHGLPSLKYGLETGNLILLVFEMETAMYAALQRLLIRPGFGEFAGFVASSTLGRLKENFMDWWYVHEGEIRAGALF
jgi:hypothetical protein